MTPIEASIIKNENLLLKWLYVWVPSKPTPKLVLPVSKLTDMKDQVLMGTFYSHELQKILVDPNATYKIEKVLETKRGYVFVKFVGWPNKFNMWIPSKNVSRV